MIIFFETYGEQIVLGLIITVIGGILLILVIFLFKKIINFFKKIFQKICQRSIKVKAKILDGVWKNEFEKMGSQKALILFNCKEFLDIFEKMPELDCAITVNEINMKVNMSFITHKSLNLRRKDELKSDNIKIIDMGSNIQTCGFIIPISKNK